MLAQAEALKNLRDRIPAFRHLTHCVSLEILAEI